MPEDLMPVNMPADIPSETLNFHAEELLRTLQQAVEEAEGATRPLKKHLPCLSTFLFLKIHGRPVPERVDIKDKDGQGIRKIHDFYGWKAKDMVEKRGVCSGTLYRSAGYLRVPEKKRYGVKDKNRRTIHIEHTVPASCLLKVLSFYKSSCASPRALHNFLMSYSVSTAFSKQEEDSMCSGKGGVAQKTNECFNGAGMLIDDKPFSRYKTLEKYDPSFKVYNMVTQETIDLGKFTFRDHQNNLKNLAKLLSDRLNRDVPLFNAELFPAGAWQHYA